MAAARKGNYLIGIGLRKWCYNLAGFNQYGLMRDDLWDETPVVTEALRRLPEHLLDERNFRLIRALQIDARRDVLPKEQWVQYEDDVKYLEPYIKEVEKELKEKEDWNKE